MCNVWTTTTSTNKRRTRHHLDSLCGSSAENDQYIYEKILTKFQIVIIKFHNCTVIITRRMKVLLLIIKCFFSKTKEKKRKNRVLNFKTDGRFIRGLAYNMMFVKVLHE